MIRERIRCLYCRRLFRPDPRCRHPKACPDPTCQRRRRGASHKRWRDADPEVLEDRRVASREWRRAHPGYMRSYRSGHSEYVDQNLQRQRNRRLAGRVVKSIVISPQPLETYSEFERLLPVVKSISMVHEGMSRLQGAP